MIWSPEPVLRPPPSPLPWIHCCSRALGYCHPPADDSHHPPDSIRCPSHRLGQCFPSLGSMVPCGGRACHPGLTARCPSDAATPRLSPCSRGREAPRLYADGSSECHNVERLLLDKKIKQAWFEKAAGSSQKKAAGKCNRFRYRLDNSLLLNLTRRKQLKETRRFLSLYWSRK